MNTMDQQKRIVQQGTVSDIDAIVVTGPFDFDDGRVDVIAEDILKKGTNRIAFEMSQTDYLTSPGIAAIIKVLKRVQALNGTLYIGGATADMIDLLRLTKLGDYLTFL